MRNIALIAFLFLIHCASYAQDVEIRGYSTRMLRIDDWYYTDFGVDVRLKAPRAEVRMRKGVVFATRSAFSLGNHQYCYNGLDVYFFFSQDIWIGGEILTEIKPFEENDLQLTGEESVQALKLAYGPLIICRRKWTNSNFYTDYKVRLAESRLWAKTELWGSYQSIGRRGEVDILGIGQEQPNYVDLGLLQRWDMPLNDLTLAVDLLYSLRSYSNAPAPETTWGISISLLSR